MMRTQRERVMMEVGKMDSSSSSSSREQLEKSKTSMEEEDHGEEGAMLPGFRFHPTDEELVGFYLRRKVEKRPIAFEIIKQIDIYKYDPWDLPKVSSVGDKERYFFCMRGRKYKNSVRPNRVTGSGFWKATGIDKPIFSVKQPHDTVGLKKSLVYYRGSAGKGTKTDWMMHEFRLPLNSEDLTSNIALEAEVWTLCRIFRKVPTYKQYSPAVKKLISSRITKQNSYIDSSSKTCSSSLESETSSEHCVSFDGIQFQNSSMKPFTVSTVDARNNQLQHWNSMCYPRSELSANPFPVTNNYWSFWNQNCNLNNGDDIIENGSWDELRSVVELALN